MRSNTLFKRIKAACNFVFYGRGKVRLMSCGKCGSVTIASISTKPSQSKVINDDIHVDLLWSEFTQCLKCGAVCQEIQMWNFDGHPEEINKNITVKQRYVE